MSLELKIESLRARGEFTKEERERLLQGLGQSSPPAKKPVFFTPLRCFLLGAASGVGVAYLTWTFFA